MNLIYYLLTIVLLTLIPLLRGTCPSWAAVARYELSSCTRVSYTTAVSQCAIRGGGGIFKLAMPKTAALQAEALATVTSSCPKYNPVISSTSLHVFWVDATCASSSAATWKDGTSVVFTANNPDPCEVSSADPNKHLIYVRSIEAGTLYFIVQTSPYHDESGVVCERISMCSISQDCSSQASAVTGSPPSCSCTCNTGYQGSSCETRNCHKDLDCNGRGTGISGTYPNCVCSGCTVPYGGNACQTQLCHIDYDCNGRGASVSGTYPNCVCSGCTAPYGGNSCGAIVCRADTNCNGRGTSISGTYPSCVCSGCTEPYGGNDCGTRMCHLDYDCNMRGTSISGTYPDCVCSGCTTAYSGNACEARICHKDVDCQGQGISITGQYPNCVCQCSKGFGGRSCRPLTQTYVLTASPTHSRSKHSGSHSLSAAHSNTSTIYHTPSFTHSESARRTTTVSGTQSQNPTTSGSLSDSISRSPLATNTIDITFTQSFSSSMSRCRTSTFSQNRSQTRSHAPTFSLLHSTSQSTIPTASMSASRSLSTSLSTIMSESRTLASTPSGSRSHTEAVLSTPSTLVSTSTSETISNSGSIRLEPEPVILIPFAVPPETTAALATVSSALGGVSAAVDSQAVAVAGLVACSRKGGDDSSEDLRALSIVALDGTCEGVLLGNLAAVAGGAVITGLSILVGRVVQRRRIGQSASLLSACAFARAPQLLLTVCAYFMNSFALCGLQLGRSERSSVGQKVGAWISFLIPLVLVAGFPLLTFLFGARRLLTVVYTWRPWPMGTIGGFVFQSWALDPSIDSHKLFGCVFGGYHRLSCGWTLSAHFSFIAGLPMMFGTQDSGTCGPFFAISSVLYFSGAILIFVARPRRIPLSDVFHAATLIVNGLVVGNATVLLYSPSQGPAESVIGHLGTAITVLTVLRMAHSLGIIILAFLLLRGTVTGVEVTINDKDPFSDSLGGLDQDLLPHTSSNKPLLSNFDYEGLLWHLRPATDIITSMAVDFELSVLQDNSSVDILCIQSEGPEPVVIKEPMTAHKKMKIVSSPNTNNTVDDGPDEFLTEEERFRREIAKDYGRRQIEELLSIY